MTPTSKYRAPMAGYKEDIFEFGDQGAAKFDPTIRYLARHLTTRTIKRITAYTPLLEAMKDPEWTEPVRPSRTCRFERKRIIEDEDGTEKEVLQTVDKEIAADVYKIELDLYVYDYKT